MNELEMIAELQKELLKTKKVIKDTDTRLDTGQIGRKTWVIKRRELHMRLMMIHALMQQLQIEIWRQEREDDYEQLTMF